MARIRRLALAAAMACLAAGTAMGYAPIPPMPFQEARHPDDVILILILSGLFLFGVMAGAYGLFRLAVWFVKDTCCRGTGFIAKRIQASQPWRIAFFVGTLCVYSILMVFVLIASYIASLIITMLLMLPFVSWS